MLVYEWWGLNDQIKNVARELAQKGFLELAVDLMDGRVATTRNDTKRLIGRVGRTETLELSRKLLRWLKAHPDSNGRIATLGWCFSGGCALSAATVVLDDATAFCGLVNHRTVELRHLKRPVMGHFATHNMWINREMVSLFELGILRAGKRSISHWYHAGHAFVNSTRSKYDGADAKLAFKRTLAFLREELGPT